MINLLNERGGGHSADMGVNLEQLQNELNVMALEAKDAARPLATAVALSLIGTVGVLGELTSSLSHITPIKKFVLGVSLGLETWLAACGPTIKAEPTPIVEQLQEEKPVIDMTATAEVNGGGHFGSLVLEDLVSRAASAEQRDTLQKEITSWEDVAYKLMPWLKDVDRGNIDIAYYIFEKEGEAKKADIVMANVKNPDGTVEPFVISRQSPDGTYEEVGSPLFADPTDKGITVSYLQANGEQKVLMESFKDKPGIVIYHLSNGKTIEVNANLTTSAKGVQMASLESDVQLILQNAFMPEFANSEDGIVMTRGDEQYRFDIAKGDWVLVEVAQPTPEPTAAVPEATAISSMEAFDPNWYREQGKVVIVEDFHGYGRATLTVEGVKNLAPGQKVEYKQFRSQGKANLDGYTIWNASVHSVQLVKVDLEENTLADGKKIADGYVCQMDLAVDEKGDGNVEVFSLSNKGNLFNKNDPQKCYNDLNPGDVIDRIVLWFSENQLSQAESQAVLNENALPEDQIPIARFGLLGYGNQAITWNKIIEKIVNGETLDISEVSVLKIN